MSELIKNLAVEHLTLTYDGTSNSLRLDGLDKLVEAIKVKERERSVFIIEQYALKGSPYLLIDICNAIKDKGDL